MANRAEQQSKASNEVVSAPDYRALADFRFAIRRFLAFSEEAAAREGLTSQQHQVLLTIKGVGASHGVSIGVLAERLIVRQQSAVELVDRLEKLTLVRRAADLEDKRRTLVVLTETGEDKLQRLSASHLAELRGIAPTMADLLSTFEPVSQVSTEAALSSKASRRRGRQS